MAICVSAIYVRSFAGVLIGSRHPLPYEYPIGLPKGH